MLGLGVLSLAIPHNREVTFGTCFFCFGELNGTCGHMHMFMLAFSVHTHRHTQTPPVFTLAEPKGVSLFLHVFHNGGFPVHI